MYYITIIDISCNPTTLISCLFASTTRLEFCDKDFIRDTMKLKMADSKRIKQQEIPFIIDGRSIIKGVTKHTTCSDVINKLPNLHAPLAVFESVDGVEKELPGKTKLLKVWRAHGSSKTLKFVIKMSHVVNIEKKHTWKLFSERKQCGKQGVRRAQEKELSKVTLKNVSDLAFYIRYQKTKVQALNTKMETTHQGSDQSRFIRGMPSNASVNSMDAFLAKTDLNEMERFLSFCGEVTAEKLGHGKSVRQSIGTSEKISNYRTKPTTNKSFIDRKNRKHMIQGSLKSMRLGLKQKFSSKGKVQRTTSATTIGSTDTGYHSVSSTSHTSSDDNSFEKPVVGSSMSKHHTFVFPDLTDGAPRHSTPVVHGRHQKRIADEMDNTFTSDRTLTAETLEQFDEYQGKDILLHKFIADQTLTTSSLRYSGSDISISPDIKRRRAERYSMPVFSNQEEKCRFYWSQDCDSDSDSESEMSQYCESLDVAFDASQTTDDESTNPPQKTLRRESASSNLNRFSLLSRDIGLNKFDAENGFDYSFDCSFPRMDESQSENVSLNLSYSFDESDSDAEAGDTSLDSFMNTRSFLDDGTGEVCALKAEVNMSTSV